MRLFASVAVLSMALATSVSAQAISGSASDQPAAQPAPTEASAPVAEKKKDGLVCRKEIPTGSHFPVKVCTTADQRKAQRGMAQRAQEVMQSGSPVTPN
ncbi:MULTISPECIES: hypothetical protein [unclassified Caulobacter]|jgi:hypothetical protein|uniref:hypothetical protein n=1 Tax=unclassified Caulobacter TaxID=2648921 RepID=UPI0006F7D76F|nr:MULTISPECIES: hypothetical protein [unclassified Caulobacter]KQV56184.1 hypothetical protein ASC62_20035 [Caulobacter sp. Root342]KQV70640.1 hypothetical protein ASC70_03220 [Caulobacter sp. Root343]